MIATVMEVAELTAGLLERSTSRPPGAEPTLDPADDWALSAVTARIEDVLGHVHAVDAGRRTRTTLIGLTRDAVTTMRYLRQVVEIRLERAEPAAHPAPPVPRLERSSSISHAFQEFDDGVERVLLPDANLRASDFEREALILLDNRHHAGGGEAAVERSRTEAEEVFVRAARGAPSNGRGAIADLSAILPERLRTAEERLGGLRTEYGAGAFLGQMEELVAETGTRLTAYLSRSEAEGAVPPPELLDSVESLLGRSGEFLTVSEDRPILGPVLPNEDPVDRRVRRLSDRAGAIRDGFRQSVDAVRRPVDPARGEPAGGARLVAPSRALFGVALVGSVSSAIDAVMEGLYIRPEGPEPPAIPPMPLEVTSRETTASLDEP